MEIKKPKDFVSFMVEKAGKPDSMIDKRPLGNVNVKEVEAITDRLRKSFGKRL